MRRVDRAVLAAAAIATSGVAAFTATQYPAETWVVLLGLGKMLLLIGLPVVVLLALIGAGWIVYQRGWSDAMQAVARAEAQRQQRLAGTYRIRSIGGGGDAA